MPLVIRGRTIYSDKGFPLKEIHCPQKVSKVDLSKDDETGFQCRHCSEKVVNTDHMTEDEVVALLENKHETCLFINLANPLFKVQQ